MIFNILIQIKSIYQMLKMSPCLLNTQSHFFGYFAPCRFFDLVGVHDVGKDNIMTADVIGCKIIRPLYCICSPSQVLNLYIELKISLPK
jgi:hypothetical protein